MVFLLVNINGTWDIMIPNIITRGCLKANNSQMEHHILFVILSALYYDFEQKTAAVTFLVYEY